MGTELLYPYDCLKNHNHESRSIRRVSTHTRRGSWVKISKRQHPSSPTKEGAVKQIMLLTRKQSLARFKKTNDANNDNNNNNNNNNDNFVLEQSLVNDSQARSIMTTSNTVGGVYAGSAFVVSPSPESVPLPSFSMKVPTTVDCSATRDLRRLLGLE
ncbi:hypothetical protein vseg_012214 [Gypsophila vaccaria]